MSFSIGKSEILSDLSFEVRRGEVAGLLGPNGAGKSTLLRALCRLLSGWTGKIRLEGRDLADWDRLELARRVAYVAQQTTLAFPYTAREVVMMGRLPHQRRFFFEREDDARVVDQALVATSTSHLSERSFNDLSAGERQLVTIAGALAQEADLLLLDEPTSSLDLKHRLEVLDLLRRLQSEGKTIIVVTHDLEAARRLCSTLWFLKAGRLEARLNLPQDDARITSHLIEQIFSIRLDHHQFQHYGTLELRRSWH